MSLIITSPSFRHNGKIPARHTCDGPGTSPALSWSGVPDGTKSLVLIVDDPDAPDPSAPEMIWVHWVLYNLPPDITGLPEGIHAEDLPAGTVQGINDWSRTGYGGPCPPVGNHRYFHRIFALNTVLPDYKNVTRAMLIEMMETHVIAQAELVGLYQRQEPIR